MDDGSDRKVLKRKAETQDVPLDVADETVHESEDLDAGTGIAQCLLMLDILSDEPQFRTFVGAPKQGKSFLMKHLLIAAALKNIYDFGLVFSPTKFNKAYDWLPADAVHPRYNENVLASFIMLMRDLVENHDFDGRVFLVFDDCVGAVNWGSDLLSNLFTTFRHHKIDVYISTQYVYKVPTTVREVCDMTVMFRMTNKRSLVALYETCGQEFHGETDDGKANYKAGYDAFRRALKACTDKKYGWMVHKKNDLECPHHGGMAPAHQEDVLFKF